MTTSPDASTIVGVPLIKNVVMEVALLSFLLACLFCYCCRYQLMSYFGGATQSNANRDLAANSNWPSASNPVALQLPTHVLDRQLPVPANSFLPPSSFATAVPAGHVAVTTPPPGFPISAPAATASFSRGTSIPVEAVQTPAVPYSAQSTLAPPEKNLNTISQADLIALARGLQILCPAVSDLHQQDPTTSSSQPAFVRHGVPLEQSPLVSPPGQRAVAPRVARSEQNPNGISPEDLMALARTLKILYPADPHYQNPGSPSAQPAFPPQDQVPTSSPSTVVPPQRYSAVPNAEAAFVPHQGIPKVQPQAQQNSNCTSSHTNPISFSRRLQNLFPAALRSRKQQNREVPPPAEALVFLRRENPTLPPALAQTQLNPSAVSYMSQIPLARELAQQYVVQPPAPVAVVPYQQYWTVPPLTQAPVVPQQQHPTAQLPAQARPQQHPHMSQQMEVALGHGLAQVVESFFN